MAFSVNKVTILGNVSKDPELKYTPNGVAVATVNIATNRSIKDGENFKDIASFHRVTIWQKTAEYIAKNVKKGDKLYIEGRLDYRSYTDKSGNKVYVTDIVAESAISMTKKDGQEAQTTQAPTNTEEPKEEDYKDVVDTSDIPF